MHELLSWVLVDLRRLAKNVPPSTGVTESGSVQPSAVTPPRVARRTIPDGSSSDAVSRYNS